MTDINLEEVKEHHSGFIFGNPSSSKWVDEDGKEHDAAFNTQNGRVSYEKNEDGSYSVNIFLDGNTDEKTMTLEILTGWFYDPSEDYYNSKILNLSKDV